MKIHFCFHLALICCLSTTLASTPAAAQNQSAGQAAPPVTTPPPNSKYVYAESVPKPTLEKIPYSDRHRNDLDFWRAESDQPTPVVIVIHGGGWNGGSKHQIHRFVDTQQLLDAGISVAAIHYRLIKHCRDLDPPVQGPMTDAAAAVQFIRSMATEWNLDPERIGLTGGSAGACTALWLAYHDDLADPDSDNPIARLSTRPACVAVHRVQTTLDPVQMKSWIPNSKYSAHAFGLPSFDAFLAARDELLPKINAYSPYALLTPDDPPTYLFFPIQPDSAKAQRDPTHSPAFGIHLQQRAQELNVPCELVYPDAPDVTHDTVTDFLIAQLTDAAQP